MIGAQGKYLHCKISGCILLPSCLPTFHRSIGHPLTCPSVLGPSILYTGVCSSVRSPVNHPSALTHTRLWGPSGVLGICGEWLFIFRELGSTGNYFRGSREQAHIFGDLGSPSKKQKNKGKASICLNFLKFLLLLGG